MAIASYADEDPVADGRRDTRFAAVDLLRGTAIVAMVIYHIAFDLSAERLIVTDVAGDLAWKVFARTIAGTFLLLVGISLVLATRRGFKRDPFLRRLALIVGAAALVSLGTWWFNPETFVFFGILHEIAVASVLALPFLWLPSVAVAAVAALVIAAPWFLANPVFNTPALWWVGLSTEPPVTVDYVPIFPWFGVVLAGIVAGRILVTYGAALARWRPANVLAHWLTFASRWSLVIYLAHQPLIVGTISLALPYLPADEGVARANFMSQCVAACRPDRDEATCTAFCGCMFEGLYGTELFAMNSFAEMSPVQRETFDGILALCNTPAPPSASEPALEN